MKRNLKFIVAALAIGFAFSCVKSESFKGSYPVQGCKGIYTNVYAVAWLGIYKEPNARSIYLTDSSTFRIYLGVFGENDGFKCHVQGDKLYYQRGSWDYAAGAVAIEKKIFSLKELKREYRFERK